MSSEKSGLSRRRLFAGASAAAGAFSIVSPQAVRGSQANSQIAVGLIGAGNRGTYDARITHADPRARVTALCDLFPDRVEQAKAALKLEKVDEYSDYRQLLANRSLDAVIIATPPYQHPEQLAAAVAADKHVYCEKPAAVDVAGCRSVIATGQKASPRKVLSFGYQQRYGPVYLEGYKRLQAGAIGDLSTARAYWIAADPFTRREYPGLSAEQVKLRNWFCYRELSGDFIVEQDCHNFDVLHWFLGGLPLAAVGWGGRKVRTSMDLLDHLSLTYEWPNGIFVNFEANQLTPRGYAKVGEEFTGTKGTILVSRQRMLHVKDPKDEELMESPRDITYDGIERFLGLIQSGQTENVAERSALSTMIAILGREALYTKKEQTWKGLYGA
ncbi:MAG: Gfo/Idh/MocA family oxidoreductase [Bryobacteraceae bacterium]|nr:Gfo/Idh/MocA family oxidoreductase [Solibacteraceae bacterium]MCO5353047.1 Gfo/Idh/MocA family oxidoreductase [Bryobacteraceae bacterium]